MRTLALTALGLLLLTPAMAVSGDRVVNVNSSSHTRYQPPDADSNTRVISVKGKPRLRASARPAGDICDELGRQYYCKNIGQSAAIPETNEPIGKVAGVAWKERGETVGDIVLPEGDRARNAPAPRSGFYYLIETPEGAITCGDAAWVVTK